MSLGSYGFFCLHDRLQARVVDAVLWIVLVTLFKFSLRCKLAGCWPASPFLRWCWLVSKGLRLYTGSTEQNQLFETHSRWHRMHPLAWIWATEIPQTETALL